MKKFNHTPPTNYIIPPYLKKYLRNRDTPTRPLAKIPVDLIREAQLELVFDNMESIMLPPSIAEECARSPVLQQISITRIGSCENAKGHYIPRPDSTHETVIHICTHGEGWLKTPDGTYKINQGEAFLIPPRTPHAYGSSDNKPWSILWIHAAGTLIEEFLQLLNISASNPTIKIRDAAKVKNLHQQVFRELEQHHSTTNLISTSGKLYNLLSYLISETKSPSATTGRACIDHAITHMKNNLNSNLTLTEIAQSAGLSTSRFSYIFRKAEGISPSAYYTHLRMQQAGRQLLSNQLSISEVAQKMGYDDPYYFSRAFKSITGKSPRDYRKAFQE